MSTFPSIFTRLPVLISVEFQKLMSRTLARVGLVVALLIGILIPGVMIAAHVFFGPSPGLESAQIVALTLVLRNFFITQVFVITLASLQFAGEWQTRTLREDLVRPIPRWSILIAKWAALTGWSAVALITSFVASAILSVIVWGFTGPWGEVLTGYGLCILTDAAFASLALLVSVATRSVPGTIAGMVLLFSLEKMAGAAISLIVYTDVVVSMFHIPTWLRENLTLIYPWLPSTALGMWSNISKIFWLVPQNYEGWSWASFISFCVLLVGSLLLGVGIFSRTDVP